MKHVRGNESNRVYYATLAFGVLFTVLAGCAKSTSGGSSGSKLATSVKNSSAVVSTNAMRTFGLTQSLGLNSLLSLAPSNMGQNVASGITSMKYYINQISLCGSMTISGSAFNNPKNCISVFSGNSADSRFAYGVDSDYSNLAEAARLYTDGFIDLMDSGSRSSLNTSTPLTKDQIGSYKYGYITWYPVTKIKAEIPVGTDVYRTSDGDVSIPGNTGYVTTASEIFSAVTEAEEAVVVLGNGGNWFAFERPLEITQADIDNKESYAVDLTFNPDGLLKAYASAIGGCGTCNLKDAAQNQIAVPMLGISPVARKASDVTMKEVYQATVTGTNANGTDNFDIRLELYYVKGDLTKSVYGAGIRTLVNSDTTTFVNDASTVSFVEENADGSLLLQNYGKKTILDGLVRKESVNDTTTVLLDCSTALGAGGFQFKGCGELDGDPTELSVTFTLTAISTLQ